MDDFLKSHGTFGMMESKIELLREK
jgi:hypothetical protein